MAPDTNELIKAYKQRVFHFVCESADTSFKLVSRIYKFIPENKIFNHETTLEYVSPRNTSKNRFHDICASGNVRNHSSGLRTFYVVIRSNPRTKKVFCLTLIILIVFIKRGRFELKLLREIDVPCNDNPVEKFDLFDGPAIVCFHKDGLNCILLHNEVETLFIKERPLWLTMYCEKKNSCLSFLSSTGELKTLTFSKLHEGSVSSRIIPDKYTAGNHIMAAFVKKKANECLVVLSANQELLEYENEQLQRWCTLPFSDASVVVPYTLPGSLAFYIIVSHSHLVCLVNQKSFHVIQTWQTIDTILIDDFQFIGKPLLLLLPSTKDFSEQVLNKSILTDVEHDNLLKISAGKIGDNEISEVIKLKSFSALHRRLKETQLLFESASSESKSKLNFIKETVVRLQNRVELGSETPVECEPTLIKVTEGRLMEHENLKENVRSPITILQLYKTFMSENWILLMQIINQSKKVLGNVTLKISADESMNYYVKNIAVKREIKSSYDSFLFPDQSSLLVAIIPINQQLFSLLDVTIHLSVVYRICSESKNVLPSRNQWSILHQLSCGTIPIFKDGLNSEHNYWTFDPYIDAKVIKCPKEYLMKIAQVASAQSLLLTVKSVSTDLSNLKEMLRNLFYLKDDINLLSWKDSPFALNIWIEVQGKSKENETCLQVYYNHESQMLLFVQLFYKNFPQDVCLIPQINSSNSANVLEHLKEELKFLSTPIENFSRDEVEDRKRSTPQNLKDGNNLKRQFASEQSAFENRLNGMKIKDYQSFKEQLSSYELKCDEIIGLLQNCIIYLD